MSIPGSSFFVSLVDNPFRNTRCNFRVTPRRPGSNVTHPMAWQYEESPISVESNLSEQLTEDQYLEVNALYTLRPFAC